MVIDTTRLVYLRGDVMEDCIFIGFLESLLVLVDLSSVSWRVGFCLEDIRRLQGCWVKLRVRG